MLNWLFDNEKVVARKRVDPTISNLGDGGSTQSSDRVKMFEIFGDHTTPAGAVVNDHSAMRVSAVYACVSLITGCIGQLPLPIYERKGGARVRVEDHDLWWLLNERPCSGWTAQAFWEFMGTQMLLRGDGIAYMPRNRAGVPTAFVPYPRSRVEIQRVVTGDPRAPKRNRYLFSDEEGYFGAEQEDVLHFPGFGFNGIHSMSVIQWGARNGIGIAIKGDEHAGQFFSQGGKPEVAITTPNEMTPAQQDDFRDAWVKKYSGRGPNSIPLVLTEGLDIKELTMSAVDQQLLESRQWQVIDVARAFGVAPHLIGETTKASSFGTGIESMNIGFIKYTMGSHLKRFRDELNAKLWIQSRYFTEHNVDAFLAGDSAAQAAYFGKALGGPGAQGWMTLNEVRREKNLPPVQGGDEMYKPTAKAPAPTEKDDANS
jgi:HK97 family phage portal protein